MNKNTRSTLSNTVFIQSWLSPSLTPVLHNRDHQRLVDDLEKLDHDLKASGLKNKAIQFALESVPDNTPVWQRNRYVEFAVYALRVELLRQMLGVPVSCKAPKAIANGGAFRGSAHIAKARVTCVSVVDVLNFRYLATMTIIVNCT